MSSGWVLAIDFGTTSTAAARKVGDRVELIQIHGAPRMPSMVFWRESSNDPEGGRLVLGQEADELSNLAPWCLERSPKRRLGDEFMQLGEKQFRPIEIVAAILRAAMDEGLALSGGEAPSEVRLTHPARWGKARLEKLRQAASLAGIENPVFVPEPVAAAAHFASERLEVGQHVAVYDLGGGTFDTAVLERTADSFKVIGRPGGDEELGGEDFDDDIHRHLGEKLDASVWQNLRTSSQTRDRGWAQANRELMRRAHAAKEGLSRNPEYEFYAAPPIDSELSVTTEEFERLIAPELRGTVSELESTIRAADLKPEDLAAIYLAGGSSKIPLVGRLVEERLGIRPQHLDDPKAVIALGAARLDAPAATQDQKSDAAATAPRLVPPPPPPPGGDTEPQGTQPGGPPGPGTQPGDKTEFDHAAPPPAAPPPATPPTPAAPRPAAPKPAAPVSQKKNRTPMLIGLGILAVAVIGGGIALFAGGGGDSDSSGSSQSSDTDSDEPTDTDEPVSEEPTTPEEEQDLLQSVQPKYHATCEPEKEKNWADGAEAGITCSTPAGTTIFVETFPSLPAANRAFNVFSGSLPESDIACLAGGWSSRGGWVYGRQETYRGKLACQDVDKNAWIQWVDNKNRNVGWLLGSIDDRALAYRVWTRVVR